MVDIWIESYVKCPFFHRYEVTRGRKLIVCDGCIPGSLASHNFKLKVDAENQLTKFCCDSYRTCEMYRAILGSKEW